MSVNIKFTPVATGLTSDIFAMLRALINTSDEINTTANPVMTLNLNRNATYSLTPLRVAVFNSVLIRAAPLTLSAA
jgi:hypothetical protein